MFSLTTRRLAARRRIEQRQPFFDRQRLTAATGGDAKLVPGDSPIDLVAGMHAETLRKRLRNADTVLTSHLTHILTIARVRDTSICLERLNLSTRLHETAMDRRVAPRIFDYGG